MISSLIREIEESISSSSLILSSSIKSYYSSSKKEVYIKGVLIFMNFSTLEFSMYVLGKGKKLVFDKYRYQYMCPEKRLIFRYDNTPHYRDIHTFPFHKHFGDGKVVESSLPVFREILEEISALIAQSSV